MSTEFVILVVDDEREIREMLSRHFRLEGHQVVDVENVAQAEEQLAKKRFDVVISDIMMPGKLGTELLLKIREEYPMTRTIMITGYVTMENGLTCMRRGAETVIFKPLGDLDELDAAVKRALDDIVRWKRKLVALRTMKSGGE